MKVKREIIGAGISRNRYMSVHVYEDDTVMIAVSANGLSNHIHFDAGDMRILLKGLLGDDWHGDNFA